MQMQLTADSIQSDSPSLLTIHDVVSAKLVPVGYGIKKLQISCVVEDDKVRGATASLSAVVVT